MFLLSKIENNGVMKLDNGKLYLACSLEYIETNVYFHRMILLRILILFLLMAQEFQRLAATV